MNGEVTAGVTPRGNPAAGPAYRSTCSPAPPGSFHFLIYGLASNSRSRTFQVNELFPLGCLPVFARSCHYRCPPPSPPRPLNKPSSARLLCKQPGGVATTETTWSRSQWREKKQTLERFHIMFIFISLLCSESSLARLLIYPQTPGNWIFSPLFTVPANMFALSSLWKLTETWNTNQTSKKHQTVMCSTS